MLTIAELTMINSRLLHIFFVETGADAGITRRHALIELSRADAQPGALGKVRRRREWTNAESMGAQKLI